MKESYVNTLSEYTICKEMAELKHIDRTVSFLSNLHMTEKMDSLKVDAWNWQQYSPYTDEDPNNTRRWYDMLVARSNACFEEDFKLFLRSKYVLNRYVTFYTSAPHMLVMHSIIPPMSKLLVSEWYNYRRFNSPKHYTDLMNRDYLMITNDCTINNADKIKEIIKKRRDCFITPCDSTCPWPPKLANLYLAVIKFSSKYITMFTTFPYSNITVYKLDENLELKPLSLFQDGQELLFP